MATERSKKSVAAALVAAATCTACGVSFDPASEVRTLRVFAVQKDKPYARPGESVSMQLLWHDPARDADPSLPPPQIAWLATCENPSGDLFELCFEQFASGGGAPLEGRFSAPSAGNDRFSFTTSADIIASRPRPPDPDQLPYGLTYVFFAVCGGELTLDPVTGFACYAERDGLPGFGEGDERLGSDRFVVGYTAVFAYESAANANPRIGGITFNGVSLVNEARSAEAPDALALAPRDLCVGAECEALAPEDALAECPESLTVAACAGCAPQLGVEPFVDPASAEPDEVANALSGDTLGEQMWINYYTTLDEVDDDVRLLNDAVLGWNDDYATELAPGGTARIGYLWAVAHDNRGGTEWLRLRLCVR